MYKCTDTTSGKQTELEYVRALWSRRGSQCAGRLVELRLRGFAYDEISAAMRHLDALSVLKAGASDDVDESGGHFRFCVAHWFDIVTVVRGVSERFSSPVWAKLSDSVFTLVCKSAGWDYKEMSNRLASFNQAQKLAGK